MNKHKITINKRGEVHIKDNLNSGRTFINKHEDRISLFIYMTYIGYDFYPYTFLFPKICRIRSYLSVRKHRSFQHDIQ